MTTGAQLLCCSTPITEIISELRRPAQRACHRLLYEFESDALQLLPYRVISLKRAICNDAVRTMCLNVNGHRSVPHDAVHPSDALASLPGEDLHTACPDVLPSVEGLPHRLNPRRAPIE